MKLKARLNWVLCQIGIRRACERVEPIMPPDACDELEHVKQRQKRVQDRLQYLGYYVDVYTGDVRADDASSESDIRSAR